MDTLVRKTKHDLIFVKGGSFKMGDFGTIHSQEKLPYTGQAEAVPLHEVVLDSFSLGRFKITYADFDIYTDANGLQRVASGVFDAEYRATPDVPVGVNWPEAKAYCQWLGTLTKLPFDLPTEAQWEYAARNRGKFVLWATSNGHYDEGKNVANYAQYEQLMPGFSLGNPAVHPVGKFPPSPLGLFDMGVNGWDWVEDWFDPDYYSSSPRKNPRGPADGTQRVQRGIDGGVADTAITMHRHKANPVKKPLYDADKQLLSERWPSNGFRCAVNASSPVKP